MAEDSLFENLVRPFISAPAKIRIERRPDFMRFFLMLAPEAGIVTHLLKQDCGPDEQEDKQCRKSAAIRAGVPSAIPSTIPRPGMDYFHDLRSPGNQKEPDSWP